ncbi:MAG: NUDIX hydrolase [Candidatus Azotimanducaceae bacterium]|tara:strand:- start:395 stop:1120 length:726 start_codon:yes stop_codon:yes gene_type:complete
MKKHKNDIYEDDQNEGATESPVIAAATVLLLREREQLEVLMLQKTSKIEFGGMWVFPGGKIDPDDSAQAANEDEAAKYAAARETKEEAGLDLPLDNFLWFSHWVPPENQKKRFSTWFFVTHSNSNQEVHIDGGEIQKYQWIHPKLALEKHREGSIDLAPPTWVSLYQMSKFASVADTISELSNREPRFYKTKIVKNLEGTRTALWEGDSGYPQSSGESSDATHRLIMSSDGFVFEHSAVKY